MRWMRPVLLKPCQIDDIQDGLTETDPDLHRPASFDSGTFCCFRSCSSTSRSPSTSSRASASTSAARPGASSVLFAASCASAAAATTTRTPGSTVSGPSVTLRRRGTSSSSAPMSSPWSRRVSACTSSRERSNRRTCARAPSATVGSSQPWLRSRSIPARSVTASSTGSTAIGASIGFDSGTGAPVSGASSRLTTGSRFVREPKRPNT